MLLTTPFSVSLQQVHVSHTGSGLTVGQSHLLDEIIDNLEQELASPVPTTEGQSYYERKTLSYSLGEQHGLYKGLVAAGGISC